MSIADLKIHPQIAVVCTGNICRSPMGEVVLGARLEEAGLDYAVISAGVSDEEHGKGIYTPAQKVLRAAGYDIPQRMAHRVSDEELRSSGLILAMTSAHARVLYRRCSAIGVPVSRIHLWREFEGAVDFAPEGCFGPGGALAGTGEETVRDWEYYGGDTDVPDPWYGTDADFVATLDVVEKGAEGIIDLLRSRA